MSQYPYYRNNSGRDNQNRKDTVKAQEKFPKDYVTQAEDLCKSNKFEITNTQIRKLLNLVIGYYNQENIRVEEELEESTVNALDLIRMRMAYAAGRDSSVNNFIRTTKLMDYLKQINKNRQLFLDYTHYLESLVAFHKFYGGKEK